MASWILVVVVGTLNGALRGTGYTLNVQSSPTPVGAGWMLDVAAVAGCWVLLDVGRWMLLVQAPPHAWRTMTLSDTQAMTHNDTH